MKKLLPKILFLAVSTAICGPAFSQSTVEEIQPSLSEEDSFESETDESSFSLPHIITYVDSPVAEQRQVFSTDELEKLHVEDLPSLLREAGIQMLSYGTYGLEQKPSIRGFTDETIRVVIDGVCMNNAQYGTFDFSTIDLSSAEKVEIVRGGFTEGTEDEGSVGGTIYITTKKQEIGTSFYSDSSLKTFMAEKTPLDTFSQKIGLNSQLAERTFLKVDASGTAARNAFVYETSRNKKKERENSEVKDAHGQIQLSQFFGDGNSVTVADLFYYGNKNCPGNEYNAHEGKQFDLNNSLSASVFNPAVSNLFNLKNSFIWTKTARKFREGSGESRHFINDFKYLSSIEFFNFNKIHQTAGLSLEFVHLDSTDDGIHNQPSAVLKETTKILFNDIFSLSIPLAVKFCGENFAFTPKIGFCADFSFLELLLDAYRMVQFPNMDDLYWKSSGYSGNPDLKEEKGWGADFTINSKNQLLPFSVCIFTMWYEDKIQWSTKSGVWRPENVASALYFGVDFNAERSLFDDLLVLSVNGEYLYNELHTSKYGPTHKKRIMWTPDWTGSANARVNLKWLDFTATAQYVGKRYLSNTNESYLEPYMLFNASMSLKLWKHFKPYLRAENITGTKYVSIEGYPMPGISVTAGVKANF